MISALRIEGSYQILAGEENVIGRPGDHELLSPMAYMSSSVVLGEGD